MTDVHNFNCVLCRTTVATPEVAAARDLYLGVPGQWDYVRCGACGLVQQHPVPADLSEFYATYPVHSQRSQFFHLMRRLMMPDVYYDPDAGQKPLLLDYGCGNGDYLLSIREKATALGYELSPQLAARVGETTGLEIFTNIEQLMVRYANQIDVLTMHCVVEHLPSPRIAFDLAQRLLRPGGLMYAVLPHFDAWDRRVFGRHWHPLDAPRHISFPDVPHFSSLAADHGMKLERHKNVCFPNNIAGSISTRLMGRFNWPITAALIPAAWISQRIHPTGTRAYWIRRLG